MPENHTNNLTRRESFLFRRVFAPLTAALLLLTHLTPAINAESTAADVDALIYKTITYALDVDTLSEAVLSDDLPSDWYCIMLTRYSHVTGQESLDLSGAVEKRLAAVTNEDSLGTVERQRIALAIIALSGGNAEGEFVADTIDKTAGESGIMSLVFALHLLYNGAHSELYTQKSLASEIISLLHEDGGWGISTASDTDVTAMVIDALAPYYETDDAVAAAVDRALSYLSGAQLENGGFESYGTENAESAAQVVIALTSLGRNPDSDEDFTKNGVSVYEAMMSYLLGEGGFSHLKGGEYNSTATIQCCCAMISYLLYCNDSGVFYDFSADAKSADADTDDITSQSEASQSAASQSEDEGTAASEKDEISSVFESAPADSINDNDDGGEENAEVTASNSYKITAIVTVTTGALIVIAILAFFGKRNPKNFIFVAAVALLAIVIIVTVDFSSPDDYYGRMEQVTGDKVSVTISIVCYNIAGEADYIPNDGVILENTEFTMSDGSTVYDLTVSAAKAMTLTLDIAEGSSYVRGIENIYELDFGDLSGWVYLVNGEIPSVGCGEYVLADGDSVIWAYTLSLGEDVGGEKTW